MKIVITGITRGLGRALTEYFIAEGHTVIGCGRSGEGIMDLRFSHPAPQDFSVLDVAETTRVEMWAEKMLAIHGTPDLLINNASLMNNPAPLWEVPADKFSKLIDVNIKGVANVIRAFVPTMVKAKKGVIVNFSSGWGRSVAPKVAPYCASKWAIEGLTKALAEELPEGMAAVALNPGIINTDMLQQCWAGEADSFPKADIWAKKAGPFILALNAKDNGCSVSVGEI
ncbi:MAG: SDR family NAD(P)-dependent oxidoreductase [Verrucomicrobia bacterium]|nr:SDR family NAD(P)-dependent oxidoreductase [Verrucomicrobiota bacterium]